MDEIKKEKYVKITDPGHVYSGASELAKKWGLKLWKHNTRPNKDQVYKILRSKKDMRNFLGHTVYAIESLEEDAQYLINEKAFDQIIYTTTNCTACLGYTEEEEYDG